MYGGELTQKKETFSGLFFEEFKERFGIQEHANGEMSRKTRYFSHSSGEKSRKTRYFSHSSKTKNCYMKQL